MFARLFSKFGFRVLTLILVTGSQITCASQISEKLSSLKTLLVNKQDLQKAKTLLTEVLEELDPKEKRRSDFAKRMVIGQQEAQEYAARKNAPEPVISFYIPVYNRANVVRDTIESVLKQELSVPFEIVVVDDASTDATFSVLKEYEQKYTNFFVYRHAINKKAPASRNTAIIHCRGTWLFGVDSDDILLPGMVQEMLDVTQKNHSDGCLPGEYHYFLDFRPEKIIQTKYGEKRDGWVTVHDCLQTTGIPFTPGCRLLSKKSVLHTGGFIEAGGHDTWSFSFLQLARGCKIFVLPKCCYLHRQWSSGACYTQQTIAKNWSLSPTVALEEYAELLTKESQRLLKYYGRQNIVFHRSRLQTLHTVSTPTMLSIQRGYTLLDDGLYADACKAFSDLVAHGLDHINILTLWLKSAFYAENYEQVLCCIEEIKKRVSCAPEESKHCS